MIIGICTIDMSIYTANSLKDKRQVLKSLIERIKGKFNVSVAEVDFHDRWKNARIGLACVSTETAHCNSMLTAVLKFIEEDYRVEIVSADMEFL